MVSSSFKKPHKRTIISLDALPEDLLVEISSCIAASSLSALRHLRVVSKPFRYICDDRYVISRLSLNEITLLPWSHDPERFSNFFERCRRNGNPQALYRKGLVNYFLEDQKDKGLEFLSVAAEKGSHEANYVYGMILICLGGRRSSPGGPALLGGNTKQKGFKILSALVKPLMSKTMKELKELRKKIRDKIRDSILWRGIPVMKELKIAYVREKCECDGRTKTFLEYNCDEWHGYGEDNDMYTSSACEICLWHHEVELFFK